MKIVIGESLSAPKLEGNAAKANGIIKSAAKAMGAQVKTMNADDMVVFQVTFNKNISIAVLQSMIEKLGFAAQGEKWMEIQPNGVIVIRVAK